jgi:hypothetical protein
MLQTEVLLGYWTFPVRFLKDNNCCIKQHFAILLKHTQ